ncbi:MAG TPA: hypothetical protein PKY05_13765 [Fibrobacteria bacterium]|nr:hypothetical protein [Fibrobacteria bacterium]
MKFHPLVLVASTAFASSVVIDDFNDPYKGQTLQGWRLGAAAKAGYWYGYNDWNHGKAGLGTTMIPDVVNSDTGFSQAVVEDCGEGSPCLHVKFIGGTGYAYPFSGVGFNFLREGTDVDLSSMDSITFRAKGKGAFRFKLMTKHITDDFDRKNYWADMGRTFNLTPAWRNYRMAVDGILPQDGAPLADTATWEECADHTRKIHLATAEAFKARDTLDLWIDDIVMHGVTPVVFGGDWTEGPSAVVGNRMGTRRGFFERSGDWLKWNPQAVRSVEFIDLRGAGVIRANPVGGAQRLSGIPRGALVAKAVLADGGIQLETIVNSR